MEKRTDFFDAIDKIQRQDRYIKELEEENKKLREKIKYIRKLNTYDYNELQDLVITLEEENKKLKEEIRFLEQCLDNKEKVNKSLREELDKIKSTYVYDAKQVRDIC